MNKNVSIIFITIFSVTILLAFSQIIIITELSQKTGLSFENEDVIITIDGDYAFFTARYGLKNYGNNSAFLISLPFASRPWDINLTFNGEQIEYFWTSSFLPPENELFDAIAFQVLLGPNQEGDVLISYYRNYEIIVEDDAPTILYKYIVGSTRSWNSPLKFAHFEFWLQELDSKTLLDSRDYTNWMPTETFLYFKYTPS